MGYHYQQYLIVGFVQKNGNKPNLLAIFVRKRINHKKNVGSAAWYSL